MSPIERANEIKRVADIAPKISCGQYEYRCQSGDETLELFDNLDDATTFAKARGMIGLSTSIQGWRTYYEVLPMKEPEVMAVDGVPSN